MTNTKHDQAKKILTYIAHKILAKYKPFVIGITGSVGKTSTRHAIAAALSKKYKLREPIRNYNSEFGILLTLFGTDGLEKNHKAIGWLRVLAKALYVWLGPQDYPKMLVLEYGIDHPNDMEALLHIVKPDITVLTTIGVSHKEFFDTNEEIAQEKGKLVEALTEKGTFIYNADDALVSAQTAKAKGKTISFGTQEAGHNPQIILESVTENLTLPASTSLQIKTPTREIKFTIPVLGTGHVKAMLAAIAVAEALDVHTDLILQGLASYRPVPGRLSVLAGIRRTIVIDDSYNAAPLSTMAALELLSRFPNKSKMAALGDMLELGNATDSAHAEVGQLVAKLNLQKLITVGELGKKIGVAAEQAGMASQNIIAFETSEQA
ncbi:MAG TPA: Mur ligase family protein, partial [Patescibacteria group bacterium]|nr:Mur ligase family protein [Patescibacteria group bacterium]